MHSPSTAHTRFHHIAQARQRVIDNGQSLTEPMVEGWIERSWRRCLDWGHQPEHTVHFNAVSESQMRRIQAQSHPLIRAASAELDQLVGAIAGSRYFALLTDAQGVVIDTRGEIDRHNKHAHAIGRVGVDLSERSVGTSAIGAALHEQRPIWLHRGEHFFKDTHVFSCAGAPVFDPQGVCVGMLDLTGVDVPERPELQHLAAQSARSIENMLLRQQTPALLLHVNWAHRLQGNDNDGLLGLDHDGYIVGANVQARQMLALAQPNRQHASDVFALPWSSLFDLTNQDSPVEVPMWSGLRLHIQAATSVQPRRQPITSSAPLALKEVESDLIRRMMKQARGNVTEAARQLGISRATLYRKLAPAKRNAGKP